MSNMKTENKRKPVYRFSVYSNFWSKKSLPGYLMEKGGSFNLKLYLLYLEQIKNAPQKI